jgi:HAD superfamily hydrolase (TIGR01484 family)
VKDRRLHIFMRYDVLVIDLDGTLLRSDGSVSPRNMKAVHKARQAGLEVVVATGRALNESREVLEAIQHDGLVVAAGGALLCEAATGRTVDRRPMPHDVVTYAAQSLLDDGHKVLILKDAHATGYDYLAVGGPERELDPASQWWFEKLGVEVRHINHLHEDAHPADTIRTGAVACESRLAPLAQRLKRELGDRCCLQHWSAVTATHAIGSDTHLLEIFTPNVNKWTMIEGHCRRLGIDRCRVAAIGDGLNDVELVANAGLGVAMANSSPAVLAAARFTTLHHDDDGVAEAIDQILGGAW